MYNSEAKVLYIDVAIDEHVAEVERLRRADAPWVTSFLADVKPKERNYVQDDSNVLFKDVTVKRGTC